MGYLYNGAELPPLPITSIASTQRVAIVHGYSDSTAETIDGYVLLIGWFDASRLVHLDTNGFSLTSDQMSSRYVLENNSWSSRYDYPVSTEITITSPVIVWANYDILNEDDSVFLATSEPVFKLHQPSLLRGIGTGQRLRTLSLKTLVIEFDSDSSDNNPGTGGDIESDSREIVSPNPDGIPVMAAAGDWYRSAARKSSFTKIKFVDSYEPTGDEIECWAADDASAGTVMCYIMNTSLIISGNGHGYIMANSNASEMFGMASTNAYFSNIVNITGLDLLDTSNVTDMSKMFYGCTKLTSLDLSSFNTDKVTDMKSMFVSCNAITDLNISSFDTSNVTNMQYMFTGCNALASLDVSSFDTSNVTNMQYMFSNCNTLTGLDLINFDTGNVTSMRHMFDGCRSITALNLANFDTSNVCYTDWMFYGCDALATLNLTSFNTSKVMNMEYMFDQCRALVDLDLSNFDTSNVSSMVQMFNGCSALVSLDVSSFDTSKVTNMSYTFIGCSALDSLDLANFDTSRVTKMTGMFKNCTALTSILVGPGWTTANATTTDMFYNCGVSEVTLVES